jgi:hypothetical protein
MLAMIPPIAVDDSTSPDSVSPPVPERYWIAAAGRIKQLAATHSDQS